VGGIPSRSWRCDAASTRQGSGFACTCVTSLVHRISSCRGIERWYSSTGAIGTGIRGVGSQQHPQPTAVFGQASSQQTLLGMRVNGRRSRGLGGESSQFGNAKRYHREPLIGWRGALRRLRWESQEWLAQLGVADRRRTECRPCRCDVRRRQWEINWATTRRRAPCAPVRGRISRTDRVSRQRSCRSTSAMRHERALLPPVRQVVIEPLDG
jgi:hypothetical protein